MKSEDEALNHNFMKSSLNGLCMQCGGITDWIELNFEAYLHLECEEAADDAYWEAVYNGLEEDT